MFTDGMALRIDEATVFEPDAMVRCGEPVGTEVTELSDPVIVVEVLSPSTSSTDSNLKLDMYFRLPSVQHYLIVRTTSPAVLYYRRTAGGVAGEIVGPGELVLDPPGITLVVD
jgi:Uma2 family endonuclease